MPPGAASGQNKQIAREFTTCVLDAFCCCCCPLHQVLDVIEALFMSMFEGLKTKYAAELEAVQAQYPFTPIEAKPLRLTFAGTAGQTRVCLLVGLLVWLVG